MSILPKVVVVGGTGAQGVPAVKALSETGKYEVVVLTPLSETGKYEVVVLTRKASSEQAQALAALPRVTLLEGTYTNEADVWALFKGAYGAFVNTDGFVIGEKAEVFWGMRMFEIAVAQGVKHYVWGGVYYATKLGGFDPKYRCGHMDSKGRVTEWLLAQKLKNVTVSVFTTFAYADMLWDGQFSPVKSEDGSFTFFSSIGDGVLPVIALDDIGTYVSWMFANKERASNLDLIVVTDILPYPDIVSAFEKVTGKKAVWKDLSYDEFAKIRGMTDDRPAAWAHVPGEYHDPSGMTIKANFHGWWNVLRDSLMTWEKIDVKLLDEINPGRIRSLEEWMRRVGYNGERKVILKDMADVIARR
ncbi:NAD(P)-binding protein [Calocera viscosa TUFC12733]|uniref:NAD(P)-binding protein n=1 Tax=Calocera viscosa (strain TUFC12733) TaxID=1330018 RepID=A0A167R7H9_CALVF|nr:NAD(P)-binding protein [Calocera viscosa TUFC12733]